MKFKFPLCLMMALFPALISPTAASVAIDLKDTTADYDAIKDNLNQGPGGIFAMDNSTLNVTFGEIILNERTVDVSNNSTINVKSYAELKKGTYHFTDSTFNVGDYLTLSESATGSHGGSMDFKNSKANISEGVNINNGSVLTLSENSSFTLGGQLSMTSDTDATSTLNLNGAGTTFTAQSVNINHGLSSASAQINISGASFISKENATLEKGADLVIREGGSFTAGSFFTNNNTTVRMTDNTSITTTGYLQINTAQEGSLFTANGATLKSETGTVSLLGISKERISIENTTIIGKSIALSDGVRSDKTTTSAELSSVSMKADSFSVIGTGNGQIIISGSSKAEFKSSTITERGDLVIGQGASFNLGDLTMGGTAYVMYPGMEAYDAGHLTIDANNHVLSGHQTLIRTGSSLNIENGGKIIMGASADSSGVVNCSIFVAASATLKAEKGSQIAIDGALVVASGGTLWSGETTGTESLTTTTGVNGTVIVQDGATIGSFVHDTGERLITKSDIINSIKTGFQTGDNVQYLYQIGANTNMGTLSVENNEIIKIGDGANVTIGSIADSGHVKVTGGTVDITPSSTITLGSYNEIAGSDSSKADVKIDESSTSVATIKAGGGTGHMQSVNGETTVIRSGVKIEAASVKVEQAGTILVNNGQISGAVTTNSGAIVKGTGTFRGGLTMNEGSTLIVGNSPGVMTISGNTTLNSSQTVFSIAGTKAASAGSKGWSSKTYSNLLVQAGEFNWTTENHLTLEMASSFSPAEGTELTFNLMKFILVDKQGNQGVTSLLIGNTDLLSAESGTIEGITIDFSKESSVDGVALSRNMKDMQLKYNTITDSSGTYIRVSLSGTAGAAVPEPSTTTLALFALSGLLAMRRRTA